MAVVQIDDLANAINQELSHYSQEVTKATKANVDQVSKEADAEIKSHITFQQHTGKYVKAFRIKTSFEDAFNKRNTWYVSGNQYRLTHLLEKGHVLRNGERSKAYPHIKYGEEIAKKRMEELTKEAIENA